MIFDFIIIVEIYRKFNAFKYSFKFFRFLTNSQISQIHIAQ